MTDDRLIRGVGVSPGLALAPAVVLEWRFPDVPDRSVRPDEVDREIARLHEAVRAVADHLNMLRERVLRSAGLEESRIFEAQILMVEDQDFLAAVEGLIRQNNLSAETAFEFKALELRVAFSGAANLRMRERLADLSATQIRVLRHLMGRPDDELAALREHSHVIVVAHELSPGLTVQLDRDQLLGLVSEEGTRTSHAAILAHSLGIPAVMGAAGALARIKAGTTLLIDGQSGTILLEPTPEELEVARTQANRRHKLELELEGAAGQPAITPDGHAITLMGNVDLPDEIDVAVRNGAQGVGLLRTEFLVTGRANVPTESEQLEYFRRVTAAFPNHPVVIRTYDLGGDKFPAAFEAFPEANPFLGWRSIRVCLDRPEIFRPQIRALLRVAAERRIRVMLPLVTRVEEVLESRAVVDEEASHLAAAGIRAARTLELGVMVETPAAVVIADRLARVSAFFSVGTNDLTQYTLAVDRGSAHLASRFNPLDPAVLLQLRRVVEVGQRAGIPVSVCGEMASEPLASLLLIGMGYDTLSVSPPSLPLIKWLVRKVPMTVCREAATKALEADTAAQVIEILRSAMQNYVDKRLLGA
ncbi:MAG: phosphoenolpyruvate--protein phosphotransferase [Gemmatimonadales bacterium]|nr:phosphoenolpyruvate--protein phosphotransferase [Gemmatimonadales bacterium]